MVQPCRFSVASGGNSVGTCAPDCPGSDNPFENLSSELPMGPDFISTWHGYCGLGGGGSLGGPRSFSSLWCGATYTSLVSQVDADLMAALAVQCDPTLADPATTFYNEAQTASATCPDGVTTSSYTVPAGLFVGGTQAAANQLAENFALQTIKAHLTCPIIDPVDPCHCIGAAYNATFHSTDARTTWTMTGAPPGLVLSGSAGSTVTVSGVLGAAGIYDMVITATSSQGIVQEMIIQLSVLEVVAQTPPGYTVGVPYSYQLVALGGSGVYQWKINSGTLPAGLTLSLSGLISGIPV